MRIFVFALLAAIASGQVPQISLFAGKPPVDGPGVDLDFQGALPDGIAEDSAGNLYFPGLHVIHKLTPDGNLTRFAGTGWINGTTIDGALARETRLYRPIRPTFGPNGDLYFLEAGNGNTIRKVEAATAVIRTVYTPPVVANTEHSDFFTVDRNSRVYVVRAGSNGAEVHRVEGVQGVTARIAGLRGASSQLDGPAIDAYLPNVWDLAIDNNGDLLLLMPGDQTWIRKVNLTSFQLSTVVRNIGSISIRLRVLPNGDYLTVGNVIARIIPSTSTWTTLWDQFTSYNELWGLSLSSAWIRTSNGELILGTRDTRLTLWGLNSQLTPRPLVVNRNPVYSGVLPANLRLFAPNSVLPLEGGGIAFANDTGIYNLRPGEAVSPRMTHPLREGSYRLFRTPAGVYYFWTSTYIASMAPGENTFSNYISTDVAGASWHDYGAGLDSDGRIILTSMSTGVIYRYNGTQFEQIGRIGETAFRYAKGIIKADAQGSIYYLSNSGLVRYHLASGASEIIDAGAQGFDVDAAGNAFFWTAAGWSGPAGIYRSDAGTRVRTRLAGGEATVDTANALVARIDPLSIAVDRVSGDLYVLEANAAAIRVITGVNAYHPNAQTSIAPSGEYIFTPEGGSIDVTVTSRTDATTWQASTDQSWLTATLLSRTGTVGIVRLTAAANPNTLLRTATLRAGEASLIVRQTSSGCPYTVTPLTASYRGDLAVAAEGTVNVSTASNCRWSAYSSASWVRVTSDVNSQGLGTVRYAVSRNAGSVPRTATLMVAGKSHVVQQNARETYAASTGFVALPPCRVADTRNAAGPYGAPFVAAGIARTFSLSGRCGLTSGMSAVSVNITVVPRQSTLGYLTVWGGSGPQPLASLLNATDGRIKANAAIVSLNPNDPASLANPTLSVFANNDTDVIIDVNGYFTATGGLSFYPLSPCRIADTREGSGAFGRPLLLAGSTRSFPIPQSSCGIPADAKAYAINATVVPPAAFGYLTLYPTGDARPVVSTLNAVTGVITANAAIVPAGTNGSIDAFVSSDTDLLIDITGYFAAPGGENAHRYVPMNGCRMLDTRLDPTLALQFDPQIYQPPSQCAVPSNANSLALNATLLPLDERGVGYLSLSPGHLLSSSPVSTLNATDGLITSNAAIVIVAPGTLRLKAFANGLAHLLLDLNGFFVP